MDERIIKKVSSVIDQFINWLNHYGETSYDHQSFFASYAGGKAKALYYKNPMIGTPIVAPFIFCEAFIPAARKLFGQKLRFPIADAHYAMGFALLAQISHDNKYYEKAVHFLNVLEHTRCPDYRHFCWGYPFNWVTRNGIVKKGTPLITTTPYVYEAFKEVYAIDKNEKWLEIMYSIAEHAANDIKDFEINYHTTTCAYGPHDNKGGVINASAYRAFLLTSGYVQFSENKFWQTAERNLNFVLHAQQPDGSWYYAIDGERDFIDHFHTCFILKALAKIEQLTDHKGCNEAIAKGVKYYVDELFDDKGLPKPFSKRPRLTVYRKELYDYAECINLAVILKKRFEKLDKILVTVVEDLFSRWQKVDGSFRSRKLFFGWDNVPMHRWAQSQIFKSLCLILYKENHYY